MRERSTCTKQREREEGCMETESRSYGVSTNKKWLEADRRQEEIKMQKGRQEVEGMGTSWKASRVRRDELN